MERVHGNEYCCAVPPPAAPGFCLHMALFYRRCNRAGQPVRPTSAAGLLASPPPTPPPARALPLPPPAPRDPRTAPRYSVYRLIYEAGGGRGAEHAGRQQHQQHQQPQQPQQPPRLHSIFVETALAGPVRGLYLDIAASPETGAMRYAEMAGDDPERAAPSARPPPAPAPALQTKTLVGTIAAADLDRFRDLCRLDPHLDGPRRLVRRSQDWVHESIVRCVAAGILDVGPRPQAA